MKPAWKIGRIAGIDVKLHATFPLLIAWIALDAYLRQATAAYFAEALGDIAVLFTLVVLHELGHALAARRQGIVTRDITLLPIGGVARLEKMPERPRDQLLIALAGPAVNVVLAALTLGISALLGQFSATLHPATAAEDFLARLFWLNVSLAAFNLLPAFPLDGGRVLRALLAMKLPAAQATQVAAITGRVLAVGLGLVGLAVNPMLVLIAVFVWIGAGEEAGAIQVHSALAGVRVDQVMLTEYLALAPGDTLARAANHLLAASQQDFPVVDQGRPVGVLHRQDLLRGLARFGADATVDSSMRPVTLTARAAETVEELFARWPERDHSESLPVLRDGLVVGLFTLTNLREFLLVQQAIDLPRLANPSLAGGVRRRTVHVPV
jgi:Zn-dependent protease